eukprot:scaffold46557_cov70-Phaeocystis_antarctica.AAC.5
MRPDADGNSRVAGIPLSCVTVLVVHSHAACRFGPHQSSRVAACWRGNARVKPSLARTDTLYNSETRTASHTHTRSRQCRQTSARSALHPHVGPALGPGAPYRVNSARATPPGELSCLCSAHLGWLRRHTGQSSPILPIGKSCFRQAVHTKCAHGSWLGCSRTSMLSMQTAQLRSVARKWEHRRATYAGSAHHASVPGGVTMEDRCVSPPYRSHGSVPCAPPPAETTGRLGATASSSSRATRKKLSVSLVCCRK